MLKKTLIIFFIIVGISAVVFWVKAGNGENVTGWLWGGGTESDGVSPWDGSNTNFGWISANSSNCDVNNDGLSDGTASCPPAGTSIANYGLNIPSGNGNVTGYAWSENLGWIDFNPSGPYPTGPGYSVQRNSNNLVGWARIVSIVQAGSNSGGWQGWIKMNGNNYGVTINSSTGQLNGYAWSDELGWVDFSRAKVPPSPKYLLICRNNCTAGGTSISSLTMDVNDSSSVKACLVDNTTSCNGSNITNATTWNTSDNTKVTVSNGNLTSYNNEGSANITASYVYNASTLSDTLAVTVSDPRDITVCENGNPITTLNMNNGATKHLKAYYNTSGNCSGNDITLDSGTTWTVSPIGIVNLSSGASDEQVDAVNEGTTTITVEYKTKSKNVNVNVGPASKNWKEVTP